MTMLHRQFTALRLRQIALQLDNAAVCCPTLTDEQRARLQAAYEAMQGVAVELGGVVDKSDEMQGLPG